MDIQAPGGFTAALHASDLKDALLAYINDQSGMQFDGLTKITLYDSLGNEVEMEVLEVVLEGGTVNE